MHNFRDMYQASLSYQDTDTPIHRLNAVVKLVWTGGVVVLAMLIDHPIILLLVFLSTLPVVAIGRIWRQWLFIIQMAIWMGLVVVGINSLANPGGITVIWQSWFSVPVLGHITIRLEPVIYGLFMVVRLMAIISAFSVLTFTVRPDELLEAMLEMRLPYKTAMVATLSTRFVPTMLGDVMRITDAQRSRGLEMDKGSVFFRLRNRMSILPSMLSLSLERTIQLAEAMEARAFGSQNKRTRFFKVAYRKVDITAIGVILAVLAVALYLFFSGGTAYEYFPSLQGLGLTIKGVVMSVVIVLGLPCLALLAWLAKRGQE
ncbi:MAG: energy-coupling factor transporter transmembrane component T [Dehalococcoidales bacterium]|nr:energy-coupling factor transporter transmembrane component T [Dehalococcoidales bacterium]MDD3264758.1 energy-coupling factor transporter transmembrane component T [Dehalococcoidales bacterium]MDD4322499.1 energy-coupling factor transporter transmembrane component T [Dehalococcoidales bacterium]MDD4793874.1 energy-coupling factor transporter transmembrane component T [Dehalococcoidales bacterium]MDD5498244.1 energy-coupling factor transporter transmembrane component T [Dehalococcoidales bact